MDGPEPWEGLTRGMSVEFRANQYVRDGSSSGIYIGAVSKNTPIFINSREARARKSVWGDAQADGSVKAPCNGVLLRTNLDSRMNVGEIQSGSGQQRRTLMHASHVEAASNMAQLRDEGFNFEALDDIENLRCCCANCNGDMRQHNMFSFLDIVGRFMEDEYARWRQWRASL